MGELVDITPHLIQRCLKCDMGKLNGEVVWIRDYEEGEFLKVCGDCLEMVYFQTLRAREEVADWL